MGADEAAAQDNARLRGTVSQAVLDAKRLLCADRATDVLGAIQRKAPADYFSPDQLPPSKKRFEPRGKFLGDYSSYGLGRTREQHAAVESERGGDVRYEVFEIQAGPEIGCVCGG